MGEPAGHPFRGNQWTDTKGGASAGATVLRGDWQDKIDAAMTVDGKAMNAEGRYGSPVGVTETGHLTTEDGGQVHLDNGGLWYGAKEIEEIRAKLDPTKSWRIGSTQSGFLATNLGDKAEWDRLMGEPKGWVDAYRKNESLSYGDPNRVRTSSLPSPEIVAGMLSHPADMIARGEHMMTPAAARAASERGMKYDVKEAFKDPSGWQPEDYQIQKSHYTPSPIPGQSGVFRDTTPAERQAQVDKLRSERVAAHAELVRTYGTPEGYLAALHTKTRTELADTSPAQVMTGKVLDKLLAGEELKNYQEGVKSGVSNANKQATAYNYAMKRSMMVDAQGFGIAVTAPGSERPIHGLIVGKEGTHIEATFKNGAQYGGRSPVMVIYKDQVKEGSTVTMGDSLDANRPPVPYSNPHFIVHGNTPEAIRGSSPKDLLSQISGNPFTDPSRVYYNEVQYHKRPKAADIKHVAFGKEPTAAVKKKLIALGITYSVVNLPKE